MDFMDTIVPIFLLDLIEVRAVCRAFFLYFKLGWTEKRRRSPNNRLTSWLSSLSFFLSSLISMLFSWTSFSFSDWLCFNDNLSLEGGEGRRSGDESATGTCVSPNLFAVGPNFVDHLLALFVSDSQLLVVALFGF